LKLKCPVDSFCNGCPDIVFAGLSEFPKKTLQYEGDDDVDAMLFFLEIRKYGHLCFEEEDYKEDNEELPTEMRLATRHLKATPEKHELYGK
jgi:hypothetical protein